MWVSEWVLPSCFSNLGSAWWDVVKPYKQRTRLGGHLITHLRLGKALRSTWVGSAVQCCFLGVGMSALSWGLKRRVTWADSHHGGLEESPAVPILMAGVRRKNTSTTNSGMEGKPGGICVGVNNSILMMLSVVKICLWLYCQIQINDLILISDAASKILRWPAPAMCLYCRHPSSLLWTCPPSPRDGDGHLLVKLSNPSVISLGSRTAVLKPSKGPNRMVPLQNMFGPPWVQSQALLAIREAEDWTSSLHTLHMVWSTRWSAWSNHPILSYSGAMGQWETGENSPSSTLESSSQWGQPSFKHPSSKINWILQVWLSEGSLLVLRGGKF